MQKMPTQSGSCPQQSRPEAKVAVGVQTFMRVVDGCLTTEQPNRYPLLEQILSPANLNAAYKQVMLNKGAAGIDRMDCARLLGYLLEHKDALTGSIRQRTYRPNPVRRVEIPKEGGKKRLLGIPTVVDRMIQQSIAQVLTPIYERQFSTGSFGFRPRRGSKQALVRVTEIVGGWLPLCGWHRPGTLLRHSEPCQTDRDIATYDKRRRGSLSYPSIPQCGRDDWH